MIMRAANRTVDDSAEKRPENWGTYSLYSLAEWINGLAFRNINFGPSGRPVVKINELKYGITSQTQYTNQDFDEDYFLSKGDLLFSWSGSPETSIDAFWYSLADGWLNQHIFKVCPSPKVDRVFFFYLLKYLKPVFIEIAKNKQTTGLGHVTVGDLKRMEVEIPNSVEEQRAIVRPLYRIDSKIELDRQMNRTLEAMGKAIFKRWFIDFEFPNGEGKPFKSSGGEMVYNGDLEKELPKGWDARSFSDVIAVNPKRELLRGRRAKKVGMADLRAWEASIPAWTVAEYTSGPRFMNGDTLFARITPSLEHGKTALVSFLDPGEVGFGSTEFIVLGTNVVNSPLYIFHLARSGDIRSAAISAMTGTSGRQRVPDGLFDHLLIDVPPEAILDRFEAICAPMFNRISANSENAQTLCLLRDSILPRLMSGRVRVPVEVR